MHTNFSFGQRLELMPSKIKSILRNEFLTKPLFMLIYKLLLPNLHESLETLRSKWQMDVPGLDTKEWEDMWDYSLLQLVSARDRLIEFKILHRMYSIKQRLHKIYLSNSPHVVGDVSMTLQAIFIRSGSILLFNPSGLR